jgi:signal transduction histidine kinase
VLRWLFVLAVMVGLTVVVAPRFAERPALMIGYIVAGGGFASVAVILGGTAASRRDAWLFAGAAVGFTLDQSTWLPIGNWAKIGAFAAPFPAVLLASVILRYSSQASERVARWFIWTNVVLATAIGLATAIVYPSWTPGIPWDPSRSFEVVIQARKLWLFSAAILLLLLLARRWRMMPRLERSFVRPVLYLGSFEAIAMACYLVEPLFGAGFARVATELRTWGGVGFSLSFAASALIVHLSAAKVARLSHDLREPATAADLESLLRSALADPQLEVLVWLPELSDYVDRAGRVGSSRGLTGRALVRVDVLEGPNPPLAVLVVDSSLLRHPALTDSVVGVCRLTLARAHLETRLRSQQHATDELRAQLLSSAFEERRRLERDLHDGAQQRLLALSMRVGAASSQSQDETTRAALAVIRDELRQSLVELRDLAHGIYPEALSRGGLAVALEHVTSRLPQLVWSDVDERRWPPDLEGAAYFVACEALTNVCKHTAASEIWLTIKQGDGEMVISVRDNGPGSPALAAGAGLPGLRDRVDGFGGLLRVTSSADGTVIHATLPTLA